MLSNDKLESLFTRVLNTQATSTEDEKDLKEYIQRVFNSGTAPSPEQLWQFNNLIVKQADELARPAVKEILELFTAFNSVPLGSAFEYRIPKEHKAKVVWAAYGSSVDHVRVEGQEIKRATPTRLQTGFYYEPMSLVREDVEYFRKLVNDVKEAKVRLYFEAISKLFQAAIANGGIPAKNIKTGTNLTIDEYRELVRTISRYGGQPIFVGDAALIDHFAGQLQSSAKYNNLLTEKLKGDLVSQYSVTEILNSKAVTLTNPFVAGSGNTQTELPIDEGYVFASGQSLKPFQVVEFGGMMQETSYNSNIERVEFKIFQEAAVEFVIGEHIGYIKDDSITI